MRYEFMIGLRYLYGGRRDGMSTTTDVVNAQGARRALVGFMVASLLMIAAGRVLDYVWEGPVGPLLQVIGMVGAGLFLLLLVLLLSANWVLGLSGLLLVSSIAVVRIPVEEHQLRERFGSAWTEYSRQTGSLIPFVGRRSN